MFAHWLDYFKRNQSHFESLNFSGIEQLTENEKAIVFKSIQQFQKGENSEGKHLYNFAKDWGNQDYFETIKLFIKEEQKHALVLGIFMEVNDIPKIKSHWVDGVFRGLRKIGGLENSINVLLTAEVIAAIYYQALKQATKNKTLIAICEQIIRDEEMHINFQSQTLGMLHMSKGLFSRAFAIAKKRILMVGTIAVVWVFHSAVYRAAGYNLNKFIADTWQEYLRSENMQRGKSKITIKRKALISLG